MEGRGETAMHKTKATRFATLGTDTPLVQMKQVSKQQGGVNVTHVESVAAQSSNGSRHPCNMRGGHSFRFQRWTVLLVVDCAAAEGLLQKGCCKPLCCGILTSSGTRIYFNVLPLIYTSGIRKKRVPSCMRVHEWEGQGRVSCWRSEPESVEGNLCTFNVQITSTR